MNMPGPIEPNLSDNTEVYRLKIRNDRLFVDIGRGAYALLDTNITMSLLKAGDYVADLNGNPLSSETREVLAAITAQTGVPILGILGQDWLARRDFEIDLRKEGGFKLRRFGQDHPGGGDSLHSPMKTMLNVNGVDHLAQVGTGTFVTYVGNCLDQPPQDALKWTDSLKTRDGYTAFETALHRLEVVISNMPTITRRLFVAEAPQQMQELLQSTGCSAITGLELLENSMLRWTRKEGTCLLYPSEYRIADKSRRRRLPVAARHFDYTEYENEMLDSGMYPYCTGPEQDYYQWAKINDTSNEDGNLYVYLVQDQVSVTPVGIYPGRSIYVARKSINWDGIQSGIIRYVTYLTKKEGIKVKKMLKNTRKSPGKLLAQVKEDGGWVGLSIRPVRRKPGQRAPKPVQLKAEDPKVATFCIQRVLMRGEASFFEDYTAEVRHMALALKAMSQVLRQVAGDGSS
jgi:hypothetical protein